MLVADFTGVCDVAAQTMRAMFMSDALLIYLWFNDAINSYTTERPAI
jgi:hypothetical protein